MPFRACEQYSARTLLFRPIFLHALLLLAQSIAAESARLIEKEAWQSPLNIKSRDSQQIGVAGRFSSKI
jgi:hypothetical protein